MIKYLENGLPIDVQGGDLIFEDRPPYKLRIGDEVFIITQRSCRHPFTRRRVMLLRGQKRGERYLVDVTDFRRLHGAKKALKK